MHYKYVEDFEYQALERKISTFMTQGSTTSPAYLQWASELDSRHDDVVGFWGHEYGNHYLYCGLEFASAEPKTYLRALYAFRFSSLMKDRELSFSDCNNHIDSSDLLPQLLYIASYQGHHQILEMLVRRRFDLNAQITGCSALHMASAEGHQSIVKILLDHGAHVDLQDYLGEHSLLRASMNGHVPVVRTLLENGADVNAQSGERQRSALHTASENGHESIVQILLEHGANVDARDHMGQSALHLVSSGGGNYEVRYFDQASSVKIVQLLLDHGADVNARDLEGNSSLHNASSKSLDSIVNCSAEVQARNHRGDSALHEASYYKISVVQLLLDHGADVNARNKNV